MQKSVRPAMPIGTRRASWRRGWGSAELVSLCASWPPARARFLTGIGREEHVPHRDRCTAAGLFSHQAPAWCQRDGGASVLVFAATSRLALLGNPPGSSLIELSRSGLTPKDQHPVVCV